MTPTHTLARAWRLSAPVAAVITALTCAPIAAQTLPGEIAGHKIHVPGEPVDGTTAKLSEVEAELVAAMPPQGQVERLLQYAISHHIGATNEIRARITDWRGAISSTPALETLLEVARNGADLRVRAAAVEIDLAVANVAKTSEQAEAQLRATDQNASDARHAIWILGLLGNRGVETARIHAELRLLSRAPDDMVRFQAVAAIAYLGTDESVQDLVAAFHHDPSFYVRINGGGCGLAHCGMLTRAQRMLAVPALIAMVEDTDLDPKTRPYGYRALREITDVALPDEAAPWRAWYAAQGVETTERFRRFETDEGRVR